MKRIDKALKKLMALAQKAHKKRFIRLFMKRKEKEGEE